MYTYETRDSLLSRHAWLLFVLRIGDYPIERYHAEASYTRGRGKTLGAFNKHFALHCFPARGDLSMPPLSTTGLLSIYKQLFKSRHRKALGEFARKIVIGACRAWLRERG